MVRVRQVKKRLSRSTAVPAEVTASTWLEAQPKGGRFLKRAGDIFFALTVLVVGAPLLVLIALFVKVTSKGSAFYSQRRIGRGYRGFGCLKFRTMRKGADQILRDILERDPRLREEFQRDFKLKNDPRITPLGRFLRRTSLDELPQVFNILKGQMSVVGPRPIVWDELERYGRQMDEVLSVRPGLTGLWQVSGRNNLPYETRVKLDLYYVRHRTFWLDLRIILRTIGVVLLPMDRGAY
jgi:lipopolysaccharide/colanic/teichoic acid biosynthesis glycosyltransferase